MKNNNLFERKTISALMVGISAMMTLTAPITAYAEGEEAPVTDNPEPETQQTETAEAEPVTTAPAQEQAEVAGDAIEDIVNEVAPITTEETAASEEDGGMVAEEAVQDVIETAKAIEEAAKEAGEDIEEAEADLKEAEKADVAEQEAAREVVEIIMEAETAAEIAEQTVADAQTAAVDIKQEIDKAVEEKNEEKAKEEVEKLETLIEQAQEVVEARQTELEQLTDEYSKAKEELRKAEKDYIDALADASADVQAAKAKLDDAKTEANNLKDAVETAQEKLENESEAAKDLKEELEHNRNNGLSWDNQGEVLKAYIIDYYIPQILGTADESSVKFEKKVKGFDRQDFTYYEFKYVDKDGNEVTKYFNLDRADKQVSADPYARLGSSKEIVIFEKSELEIGADAYLRELYKDEDWFKEAVINGKNGPAYDKLKNKTKAGDFKVYSYEKDGVVYYISQEQLDGRMAETRTIGTDENGNITVDECEIKEVIQNKNNNTHGNPNIIGDTKLITTGEDEPENEIAQFIKEADSYVEQYKEYSEAVSKAADATEQAKEEVEKLEDAIEDLKSRDNYVLTAAEVLGVTDVAKFLGIEPTEEVDMNSMTIEEAIGYLDKLLDKANEKMEDAIENLETMTTQKEAAQKAINDLAKENQISPAIIIEEINNQIEDQKKETEEENKEEKEEDKDEKEEDNEEKIEEKDEEKEEEIKDEAGEEETQKEEKKQTSRKRRNTSAPENNEERRYQAEGNRAYEEAAYDYAHAQELTIVFNTLGNTVMDEAALPQQEQPVIGRGSNNNDWTEAGIIDMVNDIAEEKEAPIALTYDAAPTVKTVNKKDNNIAPVIIADEDVPLAASMPMETKKDAQMNWWWLLIVALLGVTGEEMYRRHREKELEETIKK